MESDCLSAEGLSNESIAIRLWRDEGASILMLVLVGGREVRRIELDREE